MSGVREWMATHGQTDAVAVSWAGKVKTAVQMISLCILLADPSPTAPISLEVIFSGDNRLLALGLGLLYASSALAVHSLYGYLRKAQVALRKTAA
eukprot:CAMPEP_0184342006 /NCGR_PEP_ID=MMETSP1089-20130417/10626_1 /TAXON_ID=38269 ORGANISM="Gloeochaete wittrockiana, Strain SAG46.84" /NCGR_SAMPLE_ID=MMETSP1089 /ASSEMBLY_ACC=CAM_ASM_000445 /LENGTH=94 /DNA_ID=CAMNT_0026670643 /DNA_START=630 /DNA_END=914 /DNA_ORIENTATION=-